MKKTFDFGKIAYKTYKNAKRSNLVTVTIEFRETDEGCCFRAMGEIWNNIQTWTYRDGQCLDLIGKHINTPEFNEIYYLWRMYHLIDMNAEILKRDWNDIGYKPNKYAVDWVYREIPAHDIARIKALFQ